MINGIIKTVLKSFKMLDITMPFHHADLNTFVMNYQPHRELQLMPEHDEISPLLVQKIQNNCTKRNAIVLSLTFTHQVKFHI